MPWLDPEMGRIYDREWYRKNKKRKISVGRIWQRNHPIEMALKKERYNIKYPYARRVQQFNRRCGGNISNQDVVDMISKQNNRCLSCGEDLTIIKKEIDHIIPRSKGGSSELSNLQILCTPCNRGKHNFSWQEFLLHAKKIFSYQIELGRLVATDIADVQAQIGSWQKQTFGTIDPQGQLRKLCQEARELNAEFAYEQGKVTEEVRLEAADVAIVLMGFCERMGIDLERAITDKMAINRERKWTAQGDGTFQHIKKD